MSVKEAILEAVEKLPEDQQRDVLVYANRLAETSGHTGTGRTASLFGLFAGYAIDVSEEALKRNRKEMLADFEDLP